MSFFGTIAAAGINNELAAQRERKAREANYIYGELSANNADARTRALYNDLYSPAAQIRQLKEAGLSPSIYASGGLAGKSGTSGAQGTGAHGIDPNVYGVSALEAAQIQNIKAQTEKTKAETETEKGNNARGKAEIHKLLQESINLKAANAYTQSMTTAQNWQNYITENNANYTIQEAAYRSQQAAYEMQNTYWLSERTKQDFKFNQQVFETRVEAEKQNFVNLQIEARLKGSQEKLNAQEIENLKGELAMLYDTSMREWAKLDVQRADQEARAALIDKEVQNFERKLEQKDRELDQKDKDLRIKNRTSWFNNINSSIRTIAYSASCVASFIPTGNSTPIPPVLEPSGVSQFY